MNINVINTYCSNLHSPKNEDMSFERYKYSNTDDLNSQKYFDTCFRVDPVDGHLISDIELLNDSSTPAVLKEYIQQHSCRIVSSGDAIPSSLVDKVDPFAYITPANAQSPDELEYAFNKMGVDVKLNSLE